MTIKNHISCCLFLFVTACAHKKYYEEQHFSTGELMRKGWYCADNVPADTVYEYYKNGRLSSITVYDNDCTGELNGVCTLFHRNGNIYKTYPYIHGRMYGETNEYSAGGKLSSRGYILYEAETGDHYSYDTVTGHLSKYTFYHGYPNVIGRADYDSNRHIISQTGNIDAVMIYRTVPFRNGNQDQCLLDMVNSNPPWRRTQINISLFAAGKLVLQDSLVNKAYHRKTYNTALPVDSANYSVVQFDSVTGKYHYFTSHKMMQFY